MQASDAVAGLEGGQLLAHERVGRSVGVSTRVQVEATVRHEPVDAAALVLHLAHDLLEAAVERADQVARRAPRRRSGRPRRSARCRSCRRSGEPRCPASDMSTHELGEPGVGRRVGVGAGDQVAPVGVARPRGPDLLAVDDPAVAVAHRAWCAATRRREPASGSLMPMHHAEVPATMSGSQRRRCSGVPNCSSVGPIWRSANHDVATGAPSAMSASKTTNRSRALRPPPPSATGQVMPSQPRAGQLHGELPRGAHEPGVLPDGQVGRSGASDLVSVLRELGAARGQREVRHRSGSQAGVRSEHRVPVQDPVVQRRERIDAGRVAVAPGDAQPPGADQLGVAELQLRVAARAWATRAGRPGGRPGTWHTGSGDGARPDRSRPRRRRRR